MRHAVKIAAIAVATALSMGVTAQSGHWTSMSAVAASFSVGDILPADQVHIITSPGRYGLGPAPAGSKYAVADGKLIRIDPKSGQVLSVLRAQSKILD